MQLNLIETLSGAWSQMTRVALVISPSWFNATALVLQLEAALPWFDQNKILKLDLLVQRAANTKYTVNGSACLCIVCVMSLCGMVAEIKHTLYKMAISFILPLLYEKLAI